jgi:alkane 1-monooxygenase
LLVFADFFYFAHRAGHHRYLGTREDPSTARRGELYGEFWRRSVRAQWQIAFRFSRQGVWRGLFLQIVNLCLFGWFFGLAAALIWVYLSAVAIRLLEAVNYFQHYGLIRQGQRDPVTAWRCDSAISYFLFLGLTRHDDHHQRPAAPFVELVSMETGPELPMGYLGVAVWVKNWSRSYARWALARLDGLKAPEAV